MEEIDVCKINDDDGGDDDDDNDENKKEFKRHINNYSLKRHFKFDMFNPKYV